MGTMPPPFYLLGGSRLPTQVRTLSFRPDINLLQDNGVVRRFHACLQASDPCKGLARLVLQVADPHTRFSAYQAVRSGQHYRALAVVLRGLAPCDSGVTQLLWVEDAPLLAPLLHAALPDVPMLAFDGAFDPSWDECGWLKTVQTDQLEPLLVAGRPALQAA
jgi:hypothetical protein